MDMHTMLRALRSARPRQIAWALRYAPRRDRWKRRPASPVPPTAPGVLLEFAPQPGGGRFHFAQADLEVHFLAPDLVRITWQPGVLPIPYALARQDWPAVEAGRRESESGWVLSTEELKVIVHRDGQLSFRDASGRLLRQELPPTRCGEAWQHVADLRPEEHIYGLAERALPWNLRGQTLQLWNLDPLGYGPGNDPLYLAIPVYAGLHAQGSYLVFFENPYRATLSFDRQASARFAGGALRYYFIPGPLRRALERYSELTGRPPLPPRWALGYHQSRWGYRSADEIRQVAAGFRRHNLPLQAIHLDIDHMRGYRVFTFDEERFPEPARLARELLEQGIRLVAIVDPGVKADRRFDIFREGLERGMFCTLPNGRPVLAPVWPGWCAFPDFTDPRARSWWGQLHKRLLAAGISGCWNDMNEPAAFAAWGEPTLPPLTRHTMEGRGGDHDEAHNLYGLLMNRACYEGWRQLAPEVRPFILSRSGWAGLQAYAWNWTGDIESTWPALRQTVPMLLGLGLAGIPFCGSDIGGFGGNPSAELFLRWFQLAALTPFFRGHSAYNTARREPWTFGEPVLSMVRECLHLRERLLPYLYTLAWEAAHRGLPLMRPLFWADEGEPALWDVDDAFLLGEALLVAPILEEGVRRREVLLPRGRWYDFWEDAALEGPGPVALEGPLERIPILVRGGSVLPMEEEGRLVLHLYPPEAGTGQGRLYSDDGDGYEPGRVDTFCLEKTAAGLELTWEGQGDYPLPYAQVELRVHGMALQRAWVDGMEVAVVDDLLRCVPFRHARLAVASPDSTAAR